MYNKILSLQKEETKMAKMVKGLTKANAGKYGFEVREDLNFRDDGNYFRGFSYKGMPITQCRGDGECYLAIRVDYLRNNFTYKEWMATDEWNLCDKFNGVTEFDIEELVRNCEAVIAKVAEMNAQSSVEGDDLEKVIDELETEKQMIEEVIEKAKKVEWWSLSDYELRDLKSAMNYLVKKASKAEDLIDTLRDSSVREQKEWVERVTTDAGKHDVLSWKWYKERYIDKVA